MNTQITYPRVRSVSALTGKRLLVVFATGDRRLYDCRPLLAGGEFARLADEALFQQARADDHGYGVVWDDELDLAESELWINGIPAEPSGPANGSQPSRPDTNRTSAAAGSRR